MARYYDTAILPARPYKPKDKAKAEAGVLLVERWILARLRRHTFFSLHELNRTIAAVAFGYHVEVDKHYYSIPHALVGQHVDVRIGTTLVEAFHKGERVPAHPGAASPHCRSTCPRHTKSTISGRRGAF